MEYYDEAMIRHKLDDLNQQTLHEQDSGLTEYGIQLFINFLKYWNSDKYKHSKIK